MIAPSSVAAPALDNPPVKATTPRRRRAARGSTQTDARQLPLGLHGTGPGATSLGVPAGDTVAGAPPVPEYDDGVAVPPMTQAEVERMERVLRGEAPPDAYVPDEAENRMAFMT